jgi:hypothetical protein
MEQPDLGVSRKICEQTLHFGEGRPRENPRRILDVHQDDLDPVFLHGGHAAANELLICRKIVAAKDRISANLPYHQIGTFGDDVPVEAGELFGNVLAPDTVIDDPDLDARKPPS